MKAKKTQQKKILKAFEFSEAALFFDKTLKIIEANAKAHQLFDYPKGKLVGKSLKFLFPSDHHVLGKTFRTKNIATNKKIRKLNDRPLTGLQRDGTELKLGINISLFHIAKTKKKSGLILCRDITDKLKLKQRRVMAEEMLYEAIETIPDGFVIYDQNDELFICNQAYLDIYHTSAPAIKQGVTFEDVIRYGLERGQYPQAGSTEPAKEAWLQERLERHRNPSQVVIQETDEGRWLKIDERRTENGLIVGVRTDVTDIKRAEQNLLAQQSLLEDQARELQKMAQEHLLAKEKAEEASKAKSEFSAIISHELRTPLTGIMGITDLLLSSDLSDEHRNYIEGLKSSSNNLLLLLNDILDYSKFEAEQVILEPIAFDFNRLINNIVLSQTPAANEKIIRLVQDTSKAKEQIIVRADKTRLRQILLNFVTNAIKFTQNGTVIVRLIKQKETVQNLCLRIEIADTGIGIPDEHRDKLFKPFCQGDSSTTRKYGGTGLGLAICQKLIEAMGGRIGFDSVVDEGTTFWFEVEFPKAETCDIQTFDEPLSSLQPADHQSQDHKTRLLLAEDNKVNSKVITTVLKRMGYDVDLAENGREAYEMVQDNLYDLVLMDMQMPEMDGCEATEKIRALGCEKKDTPVIALTADVKAEKNERYQQAGINAFMSKPVDWVLLEETIKSLKF
ncbi:ATP-binding protein [Terasakiella sp. SH-1]|uniref:ATP-binding protein n=1 Tax=Terasakiella sp. SH-1 TaxID=2560057 RepID=UPI0010743403|nr:ATP-binding protein [Terasakiella sp. SH-1]